jgi:hypothetical protein
MRLPLEQLKSEIAKSLRTFGIIVPLSNGERVMDFPCQRCGKIISQYGGLCMDCADEMSLSELYENDANSIWLKLDKDFKNNDWFAKTGKAWESGEFFVKLGQDVEHQAHKVSDRED